MGGETKAYRFPEGFLWGAATSAYQIEGSPLADGAKPSILHRYAHTPGNTRNGESGDVAADHYNRWREDVALMRELGLHSYEFSIGWSRVLPDGVGAVNAKGLDFYDRLVDELVAAGVKPVPILHVWDLPGDLQDRGGWANRDSAEWFAEFASVVYERLGDRATHWMTICEPSSIAHTGYVSGALAPAVRDLYAGLRVAHNLLLAHGRAVQAFRASGAQGLIGTSTIATDVQPESDSPEDAEAAARVHRYMNELYLDPVMLGSYPPELAEWFGEAWPEVRDGDLDVISTPVDFLGFTYYFGLLVSDGFEAGAARAEEEPDLTGGSGVDPLEQLLDVRTRVTPGPKTSLGWPIHAEGLGRVMRWMAERYGNPPLIMTESGATFEDVVTPDGRVEDAERIAFIRDFLVVAHDAIADGVDLRGWFVWALLDTWEFWLGYEGRFGLVHVDYDTQVRTVKDSGRWFRDVMAANGFDAP
jgi:beta-glucosidase